MAFTAGGHIPSPPQTHLARLPWSPAEESPASATVLPGKAPTRTAATFFQ